LFASADVEHGLASDVLVQQSVEGGGRVAPGVFEFDLAAEASLGEERAQAGKVGGRAGVDVSPSGRSRV
jgi:hypothetical protein